MATESAAKKEVAAIVRRVMPSVVIARIDSKSILDSDGEKSLSITIIVRDLPPKEESVKLVEVVDLFRTWLVKHGDERFPYFRLMSEQDEREIQHANS